MVTTRAGTPEGGEIREPARPKRAAPKTRSLGPPRKTTGGTKLKEHRSPSPPQTIAEKARVRRLNKKAEEAREKREKAAARTKRTTGSKTTAAAKGTKTGAAVKKSAATAKEREKATTYRNLLISVAALIESDNEGAFGDILSDLVDVQDKLAVIAKSGGKKKVTISDDEDDE